MGQHNLISHQILPFSNLLNFINEKKNITLKFHNRFSKNDNTLKSINNNYYDYRVH